MIKKILKLKTVDFNKMYKNLYNGDFLNIKVHYLQNIKEILNNVNKVENRYGVVISKKISKSAVQRNKIKRLLFFILQEKIKIKTDTENKYTLYMIKVKKSFNKENLNKIKEEIKYAFK